MNRRVVWRQAAIAASGARAAPARPAGGDEREQTPNRDVALDELAPMPTRPSLYPTGTTYYQLPITFTIEIIDDQQPGGAG